MVLHPIKTHAISERLVRQVEQQVKVILDTIALDEAKKKELIRGDAVDKAEQLSKLYSNVDCSQLYALQIPVVLK